MHCELRIGDRPIGLIQPQLMNDPVYQGEHEANQEYVSMGGQLAMVL
jgi:hypothetical protein